MENSAKTTYAVRGSLEQRIELHEKEIEACEDEVLLRIHACGICQGDVALFSKSRHTKKKRIYVIP